MTKGTEMTIVRLNHRGAGNLLGGRVAQVMAGRDQEQQRQGDETNRDEPSPDRHVDLSLHVGQPLA